MTSSNIDPEKLLALCARRHESGYVTLSWPMVLQIIEQLRQQAPYSAPGITLTDDAIAAAEEAYMPFGDMKLAIQAAISEAGK